MKIAAMVFTLFFCFLVPIGVMAWFMAREKGNFKWIFAGGGCFVLAEVLMRLPALTFLSAKSDLSANHPLASLFLSAFLSAVLMEGIRWLLEWAMLRREPDSMAADGFAFGIAGFEALFSTGVAVFFMILIDPANMNAGNMFWGSLERIGYMGLQIMWSMLIFEAVQKHQKGKILFCFISHFAISLLALLMSNYFMMPVWVPALLILFAGACGFCLVWPKIRQPFDEEKARGY